ncbi:MAG: hypothetical protein HYT79_00290 [Elusimicrobia bacterium]|nr:hypothetical protein [Elusimicrobiota bacterium]
MRKSIHVVIVFAVCFLTFSFSGYSSIRRLFGVDRELSEEKDEEDVEPIGLSRASEYPRDPTEKSVPQKNLSQKQDSRIPRFLGNRLSSKIDN